MSQVPGGYFGRYLRVDVSERRREFVPLPEHVLRSFIGGTGLGAYILMREQAHLVDPLAPQAPLAFVFSPLVGSPLTTSAKYAVVHRSPLTMRYNDSLVSSGFALAGKGLGCDALVLTGQAEAPSVILLDDTGLHLESADGVWGVSTREAEETLRERHGSHWRFSVIGPAGERQVRFATISHDGRHAGRGGSGAVLGAKKIKAVGVVGTQRADWAEKDRLLEYAKNLSRASLGEATEKYRELGTATNLLAFNRMHLLPTRNFQAGRFEGAEQLAPEQLAVTRDKVRESCASCTIGCEHIYSLSGGDANKSDGARIEYENLFALGPLCGVSHPETVLQASRRCDDLGMDTISAGGTIAFAMECVERGLLNEPWLQMGDADALLTALSKIGARDGIGDLLAEGSRSLAQHVGGEAVEFAPHIKGLELPGYEPRASQTLALGMAVGARGADHNRSSAYEADFSSAADRFSLSGNSALLAAEHEDRAILLDSLILCKFLRRVFPDLFAASAEMLQMVTGWDVTAEEMRKTAWRIVAARKCFNVATGWQPDEDRLPQRFMDTPLPEEPSAIISSADFRQAIEEYNRQRGWHSDGTLSQICGQNTGLVDFDEFRPFFPAGQNGNSGAQ